MLMAMEVNRMLNTDNSTNSKTIRLLAPRQPL